MKRLSRIIVALLALAMVLPMALACAETNPAGETTAAAETQAPSGEVAETTAEETLFAASNIPDDLKFDGTTINILYWNNVPNPEFFVEDQTGEAVNDAIYRRNAKVQEQFGVNLAFSGTTGLRL